MKKRLLLVLLTLTLIFGLTSCGGIGDFLGGLIGTDEESSSADNNESDTEIKAADITLFGGDDDYRIVYSANATTATKDLIVKMSNKVKAVTGENPKRIGDNAKNEAEVPKEILIASTNRAESAESMDKISGVGYRVEFIGEKLVISASNDTVLEKAFEELFNAWSTEDGRVVLKNTTVITEDLGDTMTSLYANGKFKFRIVVQSTASAEVHDAAESMSGRISVLTGEAVPVVYDAMSEYTDGVYEICIGNTNRQASIDVYASLENSYSYKVCFNGAHIVVASKYDKSLVSATIKLADDITSAIAGNYCGEPAISKDYSIDGSASATLLNFQEPSGGTPRGIFTSAQDEFVFYYEDIQKTDYSDYVASLKQNGYEELQTYVMGNNEYTLLKNEDFSIYVAYLAKVGSMRVILGKPDVLQPEATEPTVANTCNPALWQLEVDNKGSRSNGGMSYVIQLTDGTFIVIDGGYNTDTEADNLYKLLKENTVGDGEPVISAWFITHLHVDHWGGLKNFSQKYSDKVDVKAFYYNFPRVELGDVGPSAQKNVEGYMNKWKNAKKYASLHSGMNFSVVDAKITVICTFEDVFPQPIDEGNDTTTVFKIEVGGQSIMFLGDAYYGESATMTSQIDASVLKSDIVQVSHHGYEGCSEGLYRAVGAKVVLWPMNIVGYEGTTPSQVFKKWYEGGPSANSYFRNNRDIKKIIVSGAGTAKLELPYTPTGEKMPDYKKIFQERTDTSS